MSGTPAVDGWLIWPTSRGDGSTELHARMANVSVSSSTILHTDTSAPDTEIKEKIRQYEEGNPAISALNQNG